MTVSWLMDGNLHSQLPKLDCLQMQPVLISFLSVDLKGSSHFRFNLADSLSPHSPSTQSILPQGIGGQN